MTSFGKSLEPRVRRLGTAILDFFAVGAIKTMRLINVDIMSNFAGALMRHLGPWLPEHRTGRTNLALAFPEKSAAEIENILRGVWDNIGRFGAEFAHIDRLWDYDPNRPNRPSRIVDSYDSEARLQRMRTAGKPALIFSAHLANWELAAVAAKAMGLDAAILYRRPNLRGVSELVTQFRSGCMGKLVPTGLDAPLKLAEALQDASHVALLVDQYATQGVPVTFFGRRTRANALIARLARQIDCPIHGIYVVRQPGNRFQIHLTDAIEPARDNEGRVDVERTMQIITDVVESWVRKHPEQWLWLHRRWR